MELDQKTKSLLTSYQNSQDIKGICNALEEELYLVGGAVREAVLGKQLTDIDLATKLTPSVVQQRLEQTGLRVVPTGISHGTISVVQENSTIEITTFRKPGPRDSHEFSSTIEEDLAGRDFTINAIAFSLSNSQIVDPFNGIQDLANYKLRAVGTAKTRFQEDPLRILRAIRFGPAQARTMEDAMVSSIKQCKALLQEVSIERIQSEFVKIITQTHAGQALKFCAELALLQDLIPIITASIGFEQNEFHSEDVFDHTITVLERCEPDTTLRLAALFHDLGKPETLSIGEDGRRHFYKHEQASAQHAKDWMQKLRFSKEQTKAVSRLVELHMRPLECGPAGVRRIIRDTDQLFDTWLKLKIADKPPVMPEEEFQAILDRFKDLVEIEKNRPVGSPYAALAINGNDLQTLGMKPGKDIGAMLKRLNELVIESPDLNTHEQLVSAAKEYLSET